MSAPPPNFPPPSHSGPYGHHQHGYGTPPPTAPQVGSIPLSPQTLGTVYSGAWRTVKQSTGAMLGQPALWYSLAALLLTVPLTIWTVRFLNYMLAISRTPGVSEYYGAEQVRAIIAWSLQEMVLWTAIGSFFYTLLVLIGTAITIAPTMRAIVGLPTGAGQAWRLLKPSLPRILVGGLLLWAVTIVLFALLCWLGYLWADALISAEAGSQASVDAAVALSIGSTWFTLLSYVAQIGFTLLAIRFIYTLPAMVLENKGFFAALKRSWNLIKGRYWQVLGTMVLGSIILSFVVSLLVGLLTMAAVFAGMFTMDFEDISASLNSWGIWFGAILFLSLAISLIAMFLLLPVAFLTYADARIRKENLLHELLTVALHDPTLAAARNGDPHALSQTAHYVPGSMPNDRRTV